MESQGGKVDISVIICTCNRATMLPQAITSLIHQITDNYFTYEILIIDDGSTDDTSRVAIELIKANQSLMMRYLYKLAGGVADARNYGIANAAGHWIAFFDDDQIAESRWLVELFTMAQQKKSDCVGGSISLLLPDTNRLQLGPKSRRILGEYNKGSAIKTYALDDYPGTGNVILARALSQRIGGFNTAMREGGADSEFFARVHKEGIAIWHNPRAVAWHVIPSSRLTPEYLRWVSRKGGFASVRLYNVKGGGFQIIFHVLLRVFATMGRDLPSLIKAHLTGNQALWTDCLCTLGHTIGYLRGCLHFFLPRLFKQKSFMEYVDFRRHGGERTI